MYSITGKGTTCSIIGAGPAQGTQGRSSRGGKLNAFNNLLLDTRNWHALRTPNTEGTEPMTCEGEASTIENETCGFTKTPVSAGSDAT